MRMVIHPDPGEQIHKFCEQVIDHLQSENLDSSQCSFNDTLFTIKDTDSPNSAVRRWFENRGCKP
jgi:hypothetical protein